MGKKRNNNKSTAEEEEESDYKIDWNRTIYIRPDIPVQLLHQIDSETDTGKKEAFFRSINGHKGVTKSWTSEPNCGSPNSLLPWLRLVHDPNPQRRHRFVAYMREDYRFYPRPNAPVFACGFWEMGSSQAHGWLSRSPWLPIVGVFLPDHKRTTVMALTGHPYPAFAIKGDRKPPGAKPKENHWWGQKPKEYQTLHPRGWTTLDCNIEEPHAPSGRRRLMEFTNGIWFKDKFYALSLQGSLAVVEDAGLDKDLQITAMGKKRVVPSVPSRQFRECLVESNGEVLLIFLISINPSFQVGVVEVYKLATEELTWKRVDLIGDRTLFLGSYCCMSVKASQVGCKKNSVYFTQPTHCKGWWVYEMENNTISHEKEPVWKVPRSSSIRA
ncbi:hypothetical protein Tsubulata_016008 [Turnera subulata]|uniref:KIB1-4 beta-propeller domain-containing protein n=1 Tax=Turnera subulata TaxID=218843 RepID=A0A9Q0FKV4_9ROSI|nr:hypothetical protein Tsubulata_016008 [Turnera subulata]